MKVFLEIEDWDLFLVVNIYFIVFPLVGFIVRFRERKMLIDFVVHVHKNHKGVIDVAGEAVKLILPKFALAAPLIGALVVVVILRLMRFLIGDSHLLVSEIIPFPPVVATIIFTAGIVLCYDIHSLFSPPWSDTELRQQLRQAENWMKFTKWIPKIGDVAREKVREKIMESIPDPVKDISKRVFVQNALRVSLVASIWQCWYLIKTLG